MRDKILCVLVLFLFSLFLGTFSACGENSPIGPSSHSLRVDPGTAYLGINDSATFTASGGRSTNYRFYFLDAARPYFSISLIANDQAIVTLVSMPPVQNDCDCALLYVRSPHVKETLTVAAKISYKR